MYRISAYRVAIFFVAAFSACTPEEELSTGSPQEVELWEFGGVPGSRDWVRSAVENFNSSQNDIHVTLEFRDWATQREGLISVVVAGEGPDLIRVHHKYAVEFGEEGVLYALENFQDFPSVRERILETAWEHVAHEGKHYGIPELVLPFVLGVNKEILKRFNLQVPKTWEDMLAMGSELQKHGIHVFVMPGGLNQDTAYTFLPFLYAAGGRVLNKDLERAAFNGPAGIAALSFLVEMHSKGYMPEAVPAYKYDESAAHWSTGSAAFTVAGPWFQNMVSENYNFDLANLGLAPHPIPAEKPGPYTSRPVIDVTIVSIMSFSPVPEAAWVVAKALRVEDPVWLQPASAMGGFPSLKAAYEPGVESDFIDYQVMAEVGRTGLGWPGHPMITEIQNHLASAVNKALTGTLSPQEALNAAASDVNEMLQDR